MTNVVAGSGARMETARATPRAFVVTLLVAAVFAAMHLASLPPTLEDLDSVNFAFGVRDFDVAQHQPHPPGYPVFVALAKVATIVSLAFGHLQPEIAGLAALSAVGGAALLVLAFVFFQALGGDSRAALIAVFLMAAAPLVWFNALRPLSDLAGLATAFASLAALARAPSGDVWTLARSRLFVAGGLLAGLAIGFRSQMALLVVPWLAVVTFAPAGRVPVGVRVAGLGASAVGVLLWAIPLVIASGGLTAYLEALGGQAGEDFGGVVMLWTHRSIRVAVFALLNTLVLPWDSAVLAGTVLALAAAGALALAWQSRRTAVLLIVAFGPYLIFHLLFQETVTTRYALPLVPAMAFLAARVIAEARSVAALLATGALAAAGLFQALPAGAGFSQTPSPMFGLLAESRMLADRGAEPIVGMHRRVLSESRRARQWAGPIPGRLLPASRDYEWLELTRAWRAGYDGETWFVADPRRTDLALIDAQYRRTRTYRWPFDAAVYVGGARPGEVEWHIYNQPGWFLEEGWALTPEIAGITERDGAGPHLRPSVGWIRRRSGGAVLMLGGRHLGAASDPPVRVEVAIDGRPVQSLEVAPGFFLDFHELPSGSLTGTGRFARLTVTARSLTGGVVPPVGIEQFNLQDPDIVQHGFGEGWYEPELDPRTTRSWRWMSGRAVVQVRQTGQDVRLVAEGASPLRDFASAPLVRVRAGAEVLSETHPAGEFTLEVIVPLAALEASGGQVTLETDRTFVPAARGDGADRRQLALKIYRLTIEGTGSLKGQSP